MTDTSAPSLRSSGTEAIYQVYFDYVWTNLRRLGVPRSLLEDACHDVFLVAHRRAADHDEGRCTMKTWLFGISRRVAADHRRRVQRERQRLARLALVEPRPVHPGEMWSNRVWMQDFLGRLQPPQREAYVMLELEQMTAREASAVSGVNANTLAARLRAARAQLKSSLAADRSSPDPRSLVDDARRSDSVAEPARRRVLAGLLPLWSTGVSTSVQGPTSDSGSSLSSGFAGVKGWIAGAAATLAVVAADPSRAAGSPASEPAVALASTPVIRVEPPPRPALSPPTPSPPAPIPTLNPRPVSPPPPASTSPPPPASPAASVAEPPAPRPRRRRAPKATPDPLPKETDLTAQTQLAGRVFASHDPQTVLDLVATYRRRFGRGFHGDRLAVHEIEALCRLGRSARARARLDALRRRSAPLAEQAQRRCDRSTTTVTKTEPSRHQDGT